MSVRKIKLPENRNVITTKEETTFVFECPKCIKGTLEYTKESFMTTIPKRIYKCKECSHVVTITFNDNI